MKSLSFIFSLLAGLVTIFPLPVCSSQENGEKTFFVVTGHILNKKVAVGINQEFLENAVPFINSIHPDFLILTGDTIYQEYWKPEDNLPIEIIKRKYDFLVTSVFNKIDTEIYCVAGNHDTGWIPHPPSIEIFEKTLNQLQFSLKHKGSLFLFFSPYQPFPHTEPPTMFNSNKFDTLASKAFLDNLRTELKGEYDHVFIFVHFSPLSDYPIGYYWSQFLIPLFLNLKQDVHIFSTNHFTRAPLISKIDHLVRHKNIRFYCFAEFPTSIYIVSFNNCEVEVNLLQGSNLTPTPIQETHFQPTTRLSMALNWIELIWSYNKLIQKVRQLFR